MVGIFKREVVISHRNKALFGVAMKKSAIYTTRKIRIRDGN